MSELFIKQELFKSLPTVDALIFDVDGVLLDVSQSFRVVVCSIVQFYAVNTLQLESNAPLLLPEEVELFKFAGGFNDDWDLTNAAVALVAAKWAQSGTQTLATDTATVREMEPTWTDYTAQLKRSGNPGVQQAERYVLDMLAPNERREFANVWNPKAVTRLFQEMYGGDEGCHDLYGFDPETLHGEGLYLQEKSLLDNALLPKKLKLGLLTGRTLSETRLAMRHAGLSGLIPEKYWVTADDRVKKPDGQTLLLAREKMEFKSAVYIGDTMDDLNTVVNYRELKGSGKGKVASAIALSGPGGPSHRREFLEAGAEIVAPDANAFLQYLAAVIK